MKVRHWILLGFVGSVLLIPPVLKWILGFEPDETHTEFPFAPIGFRAVPSINQPLDGCKMAYDLLGGGQPLEYHIDELGLLRSIQIERAEKAYRDLAMLMSEMVQVSGDYARAIIPKEEIMQRLPEGWARYIVDDCDDHCTLEKLIDKSRFLRLSVFTLKEMDEDGDGKVTKEEFRGAPKLKRFVFGTDELGRDVLIRTVYGMRFSLLVGIIAAITASILGVAWGSIAGYIGGIVGQIMMRFVDVIYGLPYIFLVILVISLTGPSTTVMLLCIACVRWLSMARMVRGLVSQLKNSPFVEYAIVMGAHPLSILKKHIIPHARGPILTWTALLVPNAIKEEAFLSFLGVGVQPPQASLGTLISDGAMRLSEYPFLTLIPGLALFMLVFLVSVCCDKRR